MPFSLRTTLLQNETEKGGGFSEGRRVSDSEPSPKGGAGRYSGDNPNNPI